MRDQFSSIPTELEEAALVDGLSIWGPFNNNYAYCAAWYGRSIYYSLVLTWNEYFLRLF